MRLYDRSLAALAGALLLSAGLSSCRDSVDDHVPMSVAVNSPSFRQGESIPDRFTCHGANVSPALSWDALPAKTKSLVLVVSDPDALLGAYVHWVLYDLPPSPGMLPENIPHQEVLPDGAKQGLNGNGSIGYTGPCPPGKSPHHYVFKLYALDAALGAPLGAGKKQIVKAMEGHVLAAGQLTATYQR